jgi:4-amino-4-deoxy-L-arabinose transferase-like glycosyltransferase
MSGSGRSRLVLVVCAVVVLIGLAYDLGGYPLLEPDEGRNAEVAREMAAQNSYVLPRLNGLPYLDKPVVYFAASALVMEVLGPTEFAARLPSLIFTLLTVAVVVWFARELFGSAGAWTAGIAFAASPFTLAYARTVIFDSALTLWITLALVAFYLAADRRSAGVAGGRGEWWSAVAWAAIGLGVLTKGPVALAVPLLVAIPYCGWRRRWRAILDPVGILLFVAIVLPWLLAVSNQVPDFLRYVLVVETAHRLATDALGRNGPWWYFLPILLGAGLPWTVVALSGLRPRHLREGNAIDHRAVFLLLWILVPLLFFSLSQSKRPQYVLPLVPALGLLVAYQWRGSTGRLPGARPAAAFLILFGLGLALGRNGIAGLLETTTEVTQVIPSTALALGAICLASGIAALLFTTRRGPALLALSLPVAAIPLVAMPLMRAIGTDRSSAELARALSPAMTDQTEVIAIGTYPLSLPFYLRRPLTLATADGSELTSNYVLRHHEALSRIPDSSLRPPDWWRDAAAFCGLPRLFIVDATDEAVRAELRQSLPLLAETRRVAAYGPCGQVDLVLTGR